MVWLLSTRLVVGTYSLSSVVVRLLSARTTLRPSVMVRLLSTRPVVGTQYSRSSVVVRTVVGVVGVVLGVVTVLVDGESPGRQTGCSLLVITRATVACSRNEQNTKFTYVIFYGLGHVMRGARPPVIPVPDHCRLESTSSRALKVSVGRTFSHGQCDKE